MRTVASIVQQLVEQDLVAFEALRCGTLNLSAFAQQLKPQVEELAWKDVQTQTIVVSLSRLQKTVAKQQSLFPTLKLSALSIKTPLCDYTFEKTDQTVSEVRSFLAQHRDDPHHVTMMTQGLSEVTVIASQELAEELLNTVTAEPQLRFEQVAAITAQFPRSYLEVPNVLIGLMAALASHSINILEIVSTGTELTVVVAQENLDTVMQSWKKLLT